MIKTFFKKIKISPSILNLGLNEIEDKIKEIEKNIDYIHIDVMDGKFVPNKTNGVEMFNIAKQFSSKPLDVHLMVQNPIDEIDKYGGADIITFHYEACNSEDEIIKVIEKIKSVNAKVGISIKPNTKVSCLTNIMKKVDMILVMSVEPGLGGQKINLETLSKVKEIKNISSKICVEVDGGVTVSNANLVREAGTDIIVAGTAIFKSKDKNKAINIIKGKEKMEVDE